MRPLVAAVAITVAVVSGCGGDEKNETREPQPAKNPESSQARREPDRPTERGSRDPARFPAEARSSFEDSVTAARHARPRPRGRFSASVDELPIRKPPLPIQQYVITKGSHEIIARPNARDYFCLGGVDARHAAVIAFYTEARRRFSMRRIRDFSLVIAPISPTLEHIRPLAHARDDTVTLTGFGQTERAC